MDLLAKGAEAELYIIDNSTLKKVRLPKPYRIEEIDTKLRSFRNRREFKVLNKLKEAGVNVPTPIEIDEKKIFFTLEYIQGKVLKEVLTPELLEKAFEQIILMHNQNIVHGDLTTLNFIERKSETLLIDFGLAEFSQKVEDKAVDLNLFFSCIKNEHPSLYTMKNSLLKLYEHKANDSKKILERLEQVEKRGRNK